MPIVDALLALSSLALAVATLEKLATIPLPGAVFFAAMARLIVGTYFYFVFRQRAKGHESLPRLRDFREPWRDAVHPLLQASIVGFWIWAPLLWCVAHTIGGSAFVQRFHLRCIDLFHEDLPAINMLLAIICIYLPAALIATVQQKKLRALFDPTYGLRLVTQYGWRYIQTFAWLQILSVCALVLNFAGTLIRRDLAIPFTTDVVHHLLVLAIAFTQARYLGRFAACETSPHIAKLELMSITPETLLERNK